MKKYTALTKLLLLTSLITSAQHSFAQNDIGAGEKPRATCRAALEPLEKQIDRLAVRLTRASMIEDTNQKSTVINALNREIQTLSKSHGPAAIAQLSTKTAELQNHQAVIGQQNLKAEKNARRDESILTRWQTKHLISDKRPNAKLSPSGSFYLLDSNQREKILRYEVNKEVKLVGAYSFSPIANDDHNLKVSPDESAFISSTPPGSPHRFRVRYLRIGSDPKIFEPKADEDYFFADFFSDGTPVVLSPNKAKILDSGGKEITFSTALKFPDEETKLKLIAESVSTPDFAVFSAESQIRLIIDRHSKKAKVLPHKNNKTISNPVFHPRLRKFLVSQLHDQKIAKRTVQVRAVQLLDPHTGAVTDYAPLANWSGEIFQTGDPQRILVSRQPLYGNNEDQQALAIFDLETESILPIEGLPSTSSARLIAKQQNGPRVLVATLFPSRAFLVDVRTQEAYEIGKLYGEPMTPAVLSNDGQKIWYYNDKITDLYQLDENQDPE